MLYKSVDLGITLDGDQILYILVNALQTNGQLNGGVAGTLMANLGLELLLKELNIPFVRTKVGERYVVEALKKKSWGWAVKVQVILVLQSLYWRRHCSVVTSAKSLNACR
jgi:phosphomannomutase